MKENICMKCGRRSCSFRSYDREDCPYEIKPPQLYEYEQDSESEVRQENANSWQKRSPFLLKHFQIKETAIDFDALKITRRLTAEVVDTTDALIVEAIKKEAKLRGFTDLYLIDRELVKKVIETAAPKRGRWRYTFTATKYAPIACTLECVVCGKLTDRIDGAVFNYCPHCGAKMDFEEGMLK